MMNDVFDFNMPGFDHFKTVDAAMFDQFSQPHVLNGCESPDLTARMNLTINEQYNYCPDCQIPMELSGSEYQCAACGLTQKNELGGNKDHDETVSGSIRITTGSNRGRFYNVAGDYTKTQRRIILTQLQQHQARYTGPAFPMNILNAVATQYNRIQKMITEDSLDENGQVCGQKKFVRRGTIKDEILAALLYFEGIRESLVRKKKDIAEFMGLATNGFSRGENILRTLEAEGKIDIPIDSEPIEGFVDRYLEALNLDNPEYSKFIIALVDESERRKIGMNSQISSKVVGAIWILIVRCRLGIPAQVLEKATDNTKKNTFAKFYNVVFQNPCTFAHIFAEHGVPLR